MSILNRGHARHGLIVPKIAPISERYYGYSAAFSGALSTLALGADILYAVPFRLQGALPSGTVDRIGLNVTTAAAAGKLLRLGIYTATAAGLPDALLVDSGALAADTAAPFIALATIDQALTPGLLYFLTCLTNGTPTVTSVTVTESYYGMADPSTTSRSMTQIRTLAYAALPAAWGTPTGYAAAAAPNICVRAT